MAAAFQAEFARRLAAADWNERRAALEELGRLEDARGAAAALELALPLLSDAECNVRRSAVACLVRLACGASAAGIAGDARERVATCLRDEDAGVRRVALGGLAELADDASAPELIDLAAEYLSDEDSDVRIAALAALGRLGEQRAVARGEEGQGDGAARAFVSPRLRDEDEEVRRAAVKAYARLSKPGDAQAFAKLRRMADRDEESDEEVRKEVAGVLPRLRQAAATTAPFSAAANTTGTPADATVTERVFFDIVVRGESLGRIGVGLYGKEVPKTVRNFVALCTGECGVGATSKPLHFKGSQFHRIIPGFMCQGGDITQGDGTGGESIYGERFADESFAIGHARAGLLSMANAGKDTNGSQFFITLKPTPHLDGKHVVFGEVIAGMGIVQEMAKLGSPSGKTSAEVLIRDCGKLE
eukprot:TRINITY_DN3394_c0_g1_i1.p1 TRINITY_DN3394_c0_g1~~TRINITY_DN3394_c0_g1_i1.p1  ORF type:complete len:417 (+),score=96.99 TRINITY_DN3394_c0_g1_i1:60-1310(+)